ncbi:MAG: peptidyl-prolyl cis-trans isomerase [Armatimonadetes bacterium]|nr:peptidyl-prolyl cis-trans isomerase [Armatimonadota bacterium]
MTQWSGIVSSFTCFFVPLLRRAASAVLMLILALTPLGMASCGDDIDRGRVVATVNGQDITYGELLRELEERQGPVVLMDLVDEAIIRQEAAKRGIKLTEEDRRLAVERAAARVGSMADLKTRLDETGIPMDAYAHSVETDVLLDRIAREEVKVTDNEISQYYYENVSEFERGPRVHARMMLFTDRGSAEAVAEVLKDPEADFAGLAKSLSEDAATAAEGGDMGYFEKDDYAEAITDVAFKLTPNAISDIIQVPDGWVILQVLDRKPAGPLTLEEVRDQIRQRLIHEKTQLMRGQWLLEARKAAKVRIGDKRLREEFEKRIEVLKPPPMPGQL